MRKPREFTFRKFLNKKGHNALAGLFIETESITSSYPTIEVEISDCRKTISLDFSCYKLENVENAIYKCDVILEGFTKLRKTLVWLRERKLEEMEES